MKVGILEAGKPPASVPDTFGSYDVMIRRLLGNHHAYDSYPVMRGAFPQVDDRHDAYVVTGSSCSVYDNAEWMLELQDFLRRVRRRTRLVGICFGHQIMAQAFGGTVEKATRGWGLGLHRYDVVAHADWMDNAEALFATASHEDQVVSLPPDCQILAASAFTPHAMLAYDDASMSVQFHPEFEPAFSRALFALRRAPDLSEAQIAAALASLDAPNDNVRIASWINRFLEPHARNDAVAESGNE